jgi:hypothetical protein
VGSFSGYLLSELQSFSEYLDEEKGYTGAAAKPVALLRQSCADIVAGKMNALDTSPFGWRQAMAEALDTQPRDPDPDAFDVESEIDRVLSRSMLEAVDAMVLRMRRIALMLLLTEPPRNVRSAIFEATRCFIFGLFRASAVMGRAVVESALEDRLRAQAHTAWRSQVLRAPPGGSWVRGWLERARSEGLVSNELFEDLDKVRLIGNGAAHGRTVSEDEALSCLIAVRRGLQHLYRAGGGRKPR